MNLIILGEIIRETRLNNTTMSQEELAEKVGLERTYISKIESGKKNVTIETLGVICEGLGIKLSDFFKIYDDRVGKS